MGFSFIFMMFSYIKVIAQPKIRKQINLFESKGIYQFTIIFFLLAPSEKCSLTNSNHSQTER